MQKMLILTVLLAGCTVVPAGGDRQGPPVEIAGRTPGPPQHCVDMRQGEGLRISETNQHTLVYGHGKTVFANFLGQCRFNPDDILVTEPFGSSICRGDIVRSLDRTSRIPGPSCVLSDFVPYTR
jgi:hypothetical protein